MAFFISWISDTGRSVYRPGYLSTGKWTGRASSKSLRWLGITARNAASPSRSIASSPLIQAAAPADPTATPRKRYTALGTQERIQTLLAQGMPVAKIAKECDVDKQIVYRIWHHFRPGDPDGHASGASDLQLSRFPETWRPGGTRPTQSTSHLRL